MKKIKQLLLALCFMQILTISYAQTVTGIKSGGKLSMYVHETSDGNFTDFSPDFKGKPETFFTEFGDDYGLSKSDRMVQTRKETDELGMKHIRYAQFHKDILVEGGNYILHSRNDAVVRGNGTIIKQLDINVQPSLSKDQAFTIAKEYVNAKKYKWETDPNYVPVTDLVITLTDENPENKDAKYVLAYKTDIYSLDPFGYVNVYIDANSGKVFKTVNLIHNGCSAGTINTLYNGSQSLSTTFQTTNYRLEEDCGTNHRKVHTRINSTNAEITDTDNSWGETSDGKIGGSVHWALEKVYDYYYSTFSRNSYNNAGATLNAYIHNNSNGNVNAFWDGSSMNFGDGDGTTLGAVVALDIAGHELTHAVTQSSANLTYSYQSGALNESFSDILGTAIEFYVKGSSGNYTLGEDIYSSNYFRSMSNPNIKSQPDTYSGTYWYTGSSDNGGVHTNSGPQNYCFYLLAEGGSGTNDIGNSFNVTGIGRTKAAAIFYRALTYYLTPTSQYIDSRNACIKAAGDLYACSPQEIISTVSAWYAIGVGGGPDRAACGDASGNYNSGTTITEAAYNTLSSGNAPCSKNITVKAGANVTFNSYKNIKLLPGFSAKVNSTFKAVKATGCFANPLAGGRISAEDNSSNESEQEASVGKELTIYPNPNDGTFTLNFPSAEAYEVQISDMLGSVILKENVSNTLTKAYSLTNISNGMYIVNVTGYGIQKRTKVQVMR